MKRRCVFSTSPSKSSVPVLMTTTRTGEDSTPNAQRPTLNVQRSTAQSFCTEELKFAAKRPTSSGVFILLLANERELFPFDHRAIDRDFSDVFAARHVINDVENNGPGSAR